MSEVTEAIQAVFGLLFGAFILVLIAPSLNPTTGVNMLAYGYSFAGILAIAAFAIVGILVLRFVE
jgi:UDP-N-acetylmuramyl pentapeptide phosphotransferase/UDP-N-acetylglucosamine-1-phosphate transferase